METLQTILEKIPIRNDLASHIILLGVVQGFFLALVIFLRTTRGSALWLYGWALLFQSLVCLDIYLCYTGLIKHMISLNDSTEPLVLLIAPSLYLFFYALLKRKSVTLRTHWPHFVFPLLYGISQTPYYLSPMAVKLNSYVAAFHRELGFVPVPGEFHRTQYFSKDLFRWMVLLSFLLYFVLSLRLLYGTLGKGALGKKAREGKFTFSRNILLFFLGLMLVVLVIFLSFEDDGGDHIIGMVQTLTLFITSFFFLAESRFFQRSWLADKYETLPGDTISFTAIEQLMVREEYFARQKFSLGDLAQSLDTHAQSVSKLINTHTGMNFNEYINQKRIELAKSRLLDRSNAHLTVEAIGQSVGFRSKSAFYSAFKKHVGQSPNAYIKQNRG